MNRSPTSTTIGAGIAFLACCAAFAWLAATGASVNGLMAPTAVGWLAALIALRQLSPPEKHTALYFAFAVLALMIFFIHETYGYKGKVRDFPLIVGYAGIVLCTLDVISVSDTRIGAAIARFFGSQLGPGTLGGRPVKRELAACAAIVVCVVGIWLIGFLAFSPLFVAAWMMIGGKKPLKHALYGGAFTLAFVYLLFEVAFQYELYRGLLFIWLLDL